jgi:NADPH:quinone reductase-like Zn-dependent oxidoreductase
LKAIVYTDYGPPNVLRLEEVEKPTPKDNEVLIRIRATTVTAADCSIRKGDPFISRFANGPWRPRATILGSELAGEVEAVGMNVKRFSIGDQVFGATGARFGTYAEYIALPVESALAIRPANVTYKEAVCSGFLTALPFLRDQAKLQSGQKALINGASGSVGAAAVQLAKLFGAEVVGVCGAAHAELVRSLGADQVIDYTKEDFTKTGQIYDVIFDTVGKSTFGRCQASLTPRGIYLTTVPTLAIMLQMLWTARFASRKAMIAFTGLRPASEKTKDLLFLNGLLEAGKYRPVIDRCYPLAQLPEAHQYVEKGHKAGDVVISLEPGKSA